MISHFSYLILLLPFFLFGSFGPNPVYGQQNRVERADAEDYYQIETIPHPEGVAMEGNGLVTLPDSRIAVGTRRGEIWILQNPYMEDDENPRFTRFAHGMHEPVGLEYKEGAFYLAQRGELTRVRDRSGDGIADSYESVYAWPQTGNHHAFSYGPKKLPDGRMWVTFGLDSPFGGQDRHASYVLWRGWTGIISDDGQFEPIATGLKQAVGFGLNAEDDMFYVEHDDPWVVSGYLTHIEKGDFLGHPAGLKWKDHPDSPVDMEASHLDMPDTEKPWFEVAREYENFKTPAVWLPTGSELGNGAQNDILLDDTGGKFGPFENQLFINEHSYLALIRVFLEKVDGTYQGAAFPFLDGLVSAPVGQTWGTDGSLFLGMTDRGWTRGGADEPDGLQRIIWNGKVPFEVKAIRAMPDGFELEFTRPADPEQLEDPSLYSIMSFNYLYGTQFQRAMINNEENPILGVKASDDGKRVRLVVDNLRKHYIHEIRLGSLVDSEGIPLMNGVAYYTLNNIPAGESLDLSETVRPEPARADEEPSRTENDASSTSETAGEGEIITGRVTEMPESWTDGPDVSINLVAIPGLQYDLESFEVPASGQVQFTLTNEDDMIHNSVIVAPDAADEVGEAALRIGPGAMQQDYIPDSDKVLFYISLLGEGESESIYFTAPREPGDYQFVCTVPGHHITMRGTMYVR